MEAAERPEERFLDDVLGLRTVPRQPQGDVVERVEVDQGNPFELFRLAVPGLPADQALPLSSMLTLWHRNLFPPVTARRGSKSPVALSPGAGQGRNKLVPRHALAYTGEGLTCFIHERARPESRGAHNGL